MKDITQKHLKSVLKYNPETGVFIWLVSCGTVKKGKLAGYIGPNGYQYIGIDRSIYLTHRLAWLYMVGKFPKEHLDHLNRVSTDNRWENLRECNYAQNGSNTTKYKNNTSGFKGVCWNKNAQKWRSQIKYEGKTHYIGSFSNKIDAAKAYNKKTLEIFGEFAYQNIIKE